MISSVAGKLSRVNKLMSVKPTKNRFSGEIGDVVIGRITELGSKRWKVDLHATNDGILLLSSVNLPGGIQRRKSESDEAAMKSFFDVGDLVSAEIQAFFADGAPSIHTRNFKYGKLRNGCLIIVPCSLIKRSKSHFLALPIGVDVILGLNGYIWISKHVAITQEIIDDPNALYSDQNESIDKEMREKIARVYVCIDSLAQNSVMIDEAIINFAFDASLDYKLVELGRDEIRKAIASQAQMEASNLHE